MDSFEWNKIAGAVLGTLIFVLVVSFATDTFQPVASPFRLCRRGRKKLQHKPVLSGRLPDWGTVLPTADGRRPENPRAANSATIFQGRTKQDRPNPWGVLGRTRGHRAFFYSGAMSASQTRQPF
jgi:cytochrome c